MTTKFHTGELLQVNGIQDKKNTIVKISPLSDTLYGLDNSLKVTAVCFRSENECYVLSCHLSLGTPALDECQCVSRVLPCSVENVCYSFSCPSQQPNAPLRVLLRFIMQPHYVRRGIIFSTNQRKEGCVSHTLPNGQIMSHQK